MRAINIFQPLAACVFLAGRDVHNLPFSTSYRGPVLIHASHQLSESRRFVDQDLNSANVAWHARAIIGSAELVAVVRDSVSPWATPGMVHWVLEEPRLFSCSVPCQGKLGIWTPDVELLTACASEL